MDALFFSSMTAMTSGMYGGMILFGLFHAIAALAFGVGVLFLVFWASKRLSEEQLKRWGWGLVAGGILIALLLGAFGAAHMRGMKKTVMWKEERGGMMDMMKEKNVMMEEGEMTMEGMVAGLRGKTGDDFDRTFLEEMIEHHQGAIDMAELAEENAKHQEVKDLSEAIISAQEREIAEMKQWLEDWGYTEQQE